MKNKQQKSPPKTPKHIDPKGQTIVMVALITAMLAVGAVLFVFGALTRYCLDQLF